MLRRKWKPFKKKYRNNKTVFLADNSPVRQFSVRIARKTYTAHSRQKENHASCQQRTFEAPTILVSSFTLKASAVYLQRGLKLDRGAQDWNAREGLKNLPGTSLYISGLTLSLPEWMMEFVRWFWLLRVWTKSYDATIQLKSLWEYFAFGHINLAVKGLKGVCHDM